MEEHAVKSPIPDPRTVFVVHGRNLVARDALFTFLRALGLSPLEWSQAVNLTGSASPYIGEVLDKAFEVAQAVVVLITPDEIAYLRREYASDDHDPDHMPAAQARPNVLFEAGMAFGRHPRHTVLVELGTVRAFSDVAGRHAIRLNNSPEKRHDLAQRLASAGCDVNTSGPDWLKAGDLTPPPDPGNGLPLGRRIPTPSPSGVRLDATYLDRGRSGGRLRITNSSTFDIHDLSFDVPDEARQSFQVQANLPVPKLPSGKSVSFMALRTGGLGAGYVDNFELTLTGRTPEGDPIVAQSFIDLN